MKKIGTVFVVLIISLSTFLIACSKTSIVNELNHDPDLIIYTTLSRSIYNPIIKEFQERNELWIEIHEGSEDDFLDQLHTSDQKLSYDLIFGISQDTLDASTDLFTSHSPFISSPLVIMYNTNVVTYREEPLGFENLTEDHWKNRIGFVDPEHSLIYEKVLNFAINNSTSPDSFENLFIENIGNLYAKTAEDINNGVVMGYYSVGITSEEAAKSLIDAGAEVTYIHPREGECVVIKATAVLEDCSNYDAAIKFLDFTCSQDVKQLLKNYLNCNPADATSIGGESS